MHLISIQWGNHDVQSQEVFYSNSIKPCKVEAREMGKKGKKGQTRGNPTPPPPLPCLHKVKKIHDFAKGFNLLRGNFRPRKSGFAGAIEFLGPFSMLRIIPRFDCFQGEATFCCVSQAFQKLSRENRQDMGREKI